MIFSFHWSWNYCFFYSLYHFHLTFSPSWQKYWYLQRKHRRWDKIHLFSALLISVTCPSHGVFKDSLFFPYFHGNWETFHESKKFQFHPSCSSPGCQFFLNTDLNFHPLPASTSYSFHLQVQVSPVLHSCTHSLQLTSLYNFHSTAFQIITCMRQKM